MYKRQNTNRVIPQSTAEPATPIWESVNPRAFCMAGNTEVTPRRAEKSSRNSMYKTTKANMKRGRLTGTAGSSTGASIGVVWGGMCIRDSVEEIQNERIEERRMGDPARGGAQVFVAEDAVGGVGAARKVVVDGEGAHGAGSDLMVLLGRDAVEEVVDFCLLYTS